MVGKKISQSNRDLNKWEKGNILVYSQHIPHSLDYIADRTRHLIFEYSALYAGGGGIILSGYQVENRG